MQIKVEITRRENAILFGCAVGDTVAVEFEQYVAAVVASEIGNSPPEACKAQAVAARTFAVKKGVLDGKTITDVPSSDQAFRWGRYDRKAYPNAVLGAEKTSREILTWAGKPIDAVYSASNGGRTVSSAERWGGSRPYLTAWDDPWDTSATRTGHGVGMSQRGAKWAAGNGYGYRQILEHYYPGCEIHSINSEVREDEEKGGDNMVTASAFIEKVRIPLDEGWGYIYGTWGTLWTEKKQKAATREMTVKYGSKWIGKMVTDCSGLLRWALHQLGEEIVHHARYQYTEYCALKGRLINGRRDDGQPIKPGTAVFLQGNEAHIHHVGVFVGDDTVIEAKGTVYGVVTSHLNHWDHWGELKMIDYSGVNGETVSTDDTPVEPQDSTAGTIIQAITINPNKWLNVRSGPGTEYPKVFQIEKGTVVEVLDAGEPDWWQIRYGGRIGWASAQYLKPVDDVPEAPDDAPDDEPDDGPEYSRDDLTALMEALTSAENALDKARDELAKVKRLAEELMKEAVV